MYYSVVIALKNRIKLPQSPWLKISLAYFVVHAIMIFVLDEITAFAPDEKNYLAIFRSVVRGDLPLDGFAGWTTSNESFLELIYLPATLLTMVGFTDLQSIRILSSLVTYLSLYMLFSLAGECKVMGMRQKNWIVLGFFIPSIILWSSLGLRESFIFMWIICIFYSLEKYLGSKRVIYAVALLASCVALAQTKNYLYAVFAIACVAASFFIALMKRTFNFSFLIVLSMVLAPIVFSPEIRSSLRSGGEFIAARISVQQPPIDTTYDSSVKVEGGETLQNVLDEAENNSIFWFIIEESGILEWLKRQSDAHLSTTSTVSSEKLTIAPASIRDPMSLLLGVVGFVVRPIPFLDNGSIFLNVLSYESVFWYPIYGLLASIIYHLVRGRNKWNLSSTTAVLFIFGFLIQSALFEVNVGTAYRHRSILLIGVMILCAVFSDKPLTSRSFNANR
jgi:hypothetical protein